MSPPLLQVVRSASQHASSHLPSLVAPAGEGTAAAYHRAVATLGKAESYLLDWGRWVVLG
jgi:hypothetical protein